MSTASERARILCQRLGLRAPILLAPMAGACPASLSIAVARVGGLGACGALLMQPDAIAAWVAEFRAGTDGPLQLNLWVPDPPPMRNEPHELRLREFLANWGPPVPAQAGDAVPPDFVAQCEALLTAGPTAVSSIMGLFPPEFVARLKAAGIAWLATATTVSEARAAEAGG